MSMICKYSKIRCPDANIWIIGRNILTTSENVRRYAKILPKNQKFIETVAENERVAR